MKITVVGGGNVGLVSACCLADHGHQVALVEKDHVRLSALKRGRPPFYEPGLEDMLGKVLSDKTLVVTNELANTLPKSGITFVCVGTPSMRDGSQNLSQLSRAAKEIGGCLSAVKDFHIVVVRSSVLPGTAEGIVRRSLEKASGKVAGVDFGLAMQPEFLREGSAIYDSLNPERVIIGEFDKRSGDALEALYQAFYNGKAPIIRLPTSSAELVKYASNAFLATKISFINEIANLCEDISRADVAKIAECMGLDSRIGPKYLNAGLGFGGSCLRKDASALLDYSNRKGRPLNLVKEVLRVNDGRIRHLLKMLRHQLGNLRGKRIAILGLSFKPGTDDIREAPAIKLIRELLKLKAVIVAYDPAAISSARAELGDSIKYAGSASECIEKADCCVVATEWPEFKRLKPEDFLARMKRPIVIDGRRVYDHEQEAFSRKLRYVAIGLNL